MEKGFFELAKKMLSEAGFKTDDNRTFTLDQQGYCLNPNIAATYSVELKEEADKVWVTTKKSRWEYSPATEKREAFVPCWWGWKTASDQAYQLGTLLRNNGCNADFPIV